MTPHTVSRRYFLDVCQMNIFYIKATRPIAELICVTKYNYDFEHTAKINSMLMSKSNFTSGHLSTKLLPFSLLIWKTGLFSLVRWLVGYILRVTVIVEMMLESYDSLGRGSYLSL